MRILLVDDDEILTQAIARQLASQPYAVDIAADGEAGWDFAQATTYDLVVLDINLPKLDGIQLCQRLRDHKYTNPILLLTAKGESSDKVMGLDAGADDYVVKPCTIEELCARIRALLRRRSATSSPVLTWGYLRLDPSTCEVTYKNQPLNLSPKEYGLLELLLRNPQRIFSSSSILEHLWGFEDAPSEETVRTHVKRLRRKLKALGAENLIDTVYGMGYRLKSPDSLSSATQARAATIALWEQFKPSVLERLAVLEQAVGALKSGTLSDSLHQRAQQAAHKLAGSLGMFGFPDGSQLGREIEDWLFKSATQTDNTQLSRLVTALQQVLQRSPTLSTVPVAHLPSPLTVNPILLVVDDDLALANQLQTMATSYGIQVEAAVDPNSARETLKQLTPSIILLDLKFPHGVDDGLVLLEELGKTLPHVPILVFTVRDTLYDRLAVVRQGSYRFISKSTPLNQVLETVRDVLNQSRSSEMHVLALDDDPLVLVALQQCLSQWGIRVTTLADPGQLWSTLEADSPDLLILDIEMPKINGIELCQVIRNDQAWNSLPILFLTTHQDPETILQIYSAGADDYVPKPFTEPELITRILNRLERNRLLRNLAETDPLTGVANRRRSTQELNRYLALRQRHHQPFCLAVIDLDHFKCINDQYGHDVGDLVIKRIANILQQAFRREDIVARWGGEEFLVGMYGITKQQAADRLQEVSRIVQQENFLNTSAMHLHLTFSAGVAEAPHDGEDFRSLYQAADIAMYQAKAMGRNRIIIYSAEYTQQSES
ncbi:MAG: response regulator [Cyanobacteria bacterium]|nr:response regulator [Cyanobacteriota bacterium]MDW8199956.1 response regulator [Cyanobacteriota bacterium SKYGB_h_bin112]